jgi:hypothetical protein
MKNFSSEPAQPIDRTRRANEAAALLQNQTLAHAFAAIEGDMARAWVHSTYEELPKREECWRMIQALALLRAKLQSFMADTRVRELDDNDAA